ncbi:MAG: PIG-L family deacetylase [Planctomycetaceae bacterium]|nr:PIG-L family deacetylase [Planctomycetaceae bacterium]
MADCIRFLRRTDSGVLATSKIAELFSDWRGADERWMFVSPHDDDVVIGAGLTFQVGLAVGASVNAVVVTDGRMGYCRFEQRRSIVKIRREETEKAYEILGLPVENLRFLECPDCNLNAYRGRHFTTIGAPTEIEGAGGMQNALTHALRQVRPNRVFLPTHADLHPDHQIVHEETLISLFHAQGNIWPELGDPIAEVPKVYEFACYCDFPEPPQIRVEATPMMLESKLDAIRAFASQEQIEAVVAIQREAGAIEYLRELGFHFYNPAQYHAMFAGAS